MTYIENVRLAIQSIKGNRLRTMLTALIIAIGLSALVGILTTLDAVKKSMTEAFSSMGANSFTIRNRGTGIRVGNGQRPKAFKSIRFEDALAFKERLKTPATIAVSIKASNIATIKYGGKKTNPNISIQGVDENGLDAQGLSLSSGRNFSTTEAALGSNVCIIGNEVSKTLFKDASPLDKIINVGNYRLKVIGLLTSKGSSMGFSGDRAVYVPLLKAKLINSFPDPSYTITVMVPSNDIMDNIIGEATSEFRNIRKLTASQTNNFEITKSDAVAQTLFENLKFIVIGGVAIGIITLIGASIGLMNIMLVSVTERTREIGIRKAIGANPAVIRKQFLIEAVVICLMGGAMGILFGILLGNAISLMMKGPFIIPWLFIIGGFGLCILVGIASGYYPAKKASKLDPVEALRYE
ncbi:ABC transporter permease [Pedobacter nutrimenti]|jgi:putative ABC transport system permease protein|uniref:Putative ABC transport system permease protein n=1 Tax=Pedobacter nutrimenti TaxID=1241337 RepID=A0A318U5X2_9SPHI|nr:ABC transporter permease [Pedobacter nutrimenti]PYF68383.1 putative ABC transport system permease protein [Pedobacter nutrimenti]|eukprot:gene12714-14923_t